ncbi:hypothetical protein Tco_0085768 [Tanacetum coccineum]
MSSSSLLLLHFLMRFRTPYLHTSWPFRDQDHHLLLENIFVLRFHHLLTTEIWKVGLSPFLTFCGSLMFWKAFFVARLHFLGGFLCILSNPFPDTWDDTSIVEMASVSGDQIRNPNTSTDSPLRTNLRFPNIKHLQKMSVILDKRFPYQLCMINIILISESPQAICRTGCLGLSLPEVFPVKHWLIKIAGTFAKEVNAWKKLVLLKMSTDI